MDHCQHYLKNGTLSPWWQHWSKMSKAWSTVIQPTSTHSRAMDQPQGFFNRPIGPQANAVKTCATPLVNHLMNQTPRQMNQTTTTIQHMRASNKSPTNNQPFTNKHSASRHTTSSLTDKMPRTNRHCSRSYTARYKAWSIKDKHREHKTWQFTSKASLGKNRRHWIVRFHGGQS